VLGRERDDEAHREEALQLFSLDALDRALRLPRDGVDFREEREARVRHRHQRVDRHVDHALTLLEIALANQARVVGKNCRDL